MSERAPQILVDDMLEAIERIQSYTKGFRYEQFIEDQKTADAVLRNLQVLGEAANRVPAATRAYASDIEWERIIRSRHIVVHNYFGIDTDLVWAVVQRDLLPLRRTVEAALRSM